MDMDSKSLNIGVYEHFKDFPNTRSVGIITDQQFVMYTQYQYDGFNHDSALPYLDKKIYPFKNYNGFYRECKDVTLAGDLNNIYIDIPETSISNPQLQLLEYVVSEIGRFNDEVGDQDKIKIIVFATSDCVENTDVNVIRQFFQTLSIRDEMEEMNEIIIGKTVDDINLELSNLNSGEVKK